MKKVKTYLKRFPLFLMIVSMIEKIIPNPNTIPTIVVAIVKYFPKIDVLIVILPINSIINGINNIPKTEVDKNKHIHLKEYTIRYKTLFNLYFFISYPLIII